MAKIKLSDICNPKQWKTIPTSDLMEEGYPVYGANGIIGYYNEFNHGNPVVTVTCRGATCGSINITVPKAYVTGNAMCLEDVRSDIEMEYLYYCLKHYDFNNVISGSAQPQITRQGMDKIYITVYAHDEQITIVNKLKRIERVIELRKQELQSLGNLIKSRFVEMFGDLHDNEKGFNVVTIEEVCSVIKDGTHQTPQYTEDRVKGFKFLSSKDIMSQKIDWSDIKYIPAELHEKLYSTIKPQRNDILMSKNGVNYGVAAINDTDEVFDIYVSIALLRPRSVIDPVFFRCVINNPETKRQFDSSIKGIGVPNLHLGEIKKTRIFLPPMKLQQEFALFVEQVDKLKLLQMDFMNFHYFLRHLSFI